MPQKYYELKVHQLYIQILYAQLSGKEPTRVIKFSDPGSGVSGTDEVGRWSCHGLVRTKQEATAPWPVLLKMVQIIVLSLICLCLRNFWVLFFRIVCWCCSPLSSIHQDSCMCLGPQRGLLWGQAGRGSCLKKKGNRGWKLKVVIIRLEKNCFRLGGWRFWCTGPSCCRKST